MGTLWSLFITGLPLLVILNFASAGTIRITKTEGSSIKVTCPDHDDVFSTSFVKMNRNGQYVTLFSKRGSQAFSKPKSKDDAVSLDERSLVMTVSNLKIKDNGATYSCKVFSSMREYTNNVIVTVNVNPKINFTVTPKGPYKDRTVITVTCVIARASPPLRQGSMSLRISGNEHKDVVMTRNADSTYRYVISRRHLVTKSSDNQETDCRATAANRHQYRKKQRIQLVRAPSGKPSISVSKTVTRPGDMLKLTCHLKKKGVPHANQYTWFKNGRVFKSTRTGSHSFKVPNQEAAGSFACKATNSEGSSNVSMPQCVAFTKEPYVGSAFPLWLSIISVLLNIAAGVFIFLFHIKPRYQKYKQEKELKSLKKLNEDSSDKKDDEASDEEKDGEKGNPDSTEKCPTEPQSEIPNNVVHVYDTPAGPEEPEPKKDHGQLGQEYLPDQKGAALSDADVKL